MSNINNPGDGEVQPTYRATVLADTPFSYWRLEEMTGTTHQDETINNNDGTASIELTNVSNSFVNLANAKSFTSDSISVPLNLSSTSVLTVEFWLKVDAWGVTQMIFEHTTNFNDVFDGLAIFNNGTAIEIAMKDSSYRTYTIPRPSLGAWHHYVIRADRTAAAGAKVQAWVDGVVQSITVVVDASGAMSPLTFANATSYWMARAGTSLFMDASLDEPAVYKSLLLGSRALAHYNAASATPATDADYLVGTAHTGLSAEIVVGTTPGGELGGTWAAPTVDSIHAGSAHHVQVHGIDGTDHTGSLTAAKHGTGYAGGHTDSGGANIEEAEVDFGNVVNRTEQTFTITDADVTTASSIIAQVMHKSPSDGRNIDEIAWEPWDIYVKPGTGTFDLTMKNRLGSVMGRFIVGYLVG